MNRASGFLFLTGIVLLVCFGYQDRLCYLPADPHLTSVSTGFEALHSQPERVHPYLSNLALVTVLCVLLVVALGCGVLLYRACKRREEEFPHLKR